MAEFTLPKNSVLIKGKTFKAPEGAINIRRFEVYRWDPEAGENPRIDAFELDMDSCGPDGAGRNLENQKRNRQ